MLTITRSSRFYGTVVIAIVLAVVAAAFVVARLIEQSPDYAVVYTVHTANSGALEVCPVDNELDGCRRVKESVFQSVFRDCVSRGHHETREYTVIVACDSDVLSSGM